MLNDAMGYVGTLVHRDYTLIQFETIGTIY